MSRQTKQMGGWGLIVALVGGVLALVLPLVWVVALVGWVIAIIGYVKASEEYGEPGIKTNTLIAIAFIITSWVVMLLGGGAMMAGMMSTMMGGGDMGMAIGGAGILGLLVGWVLSVAAGWFWYKANSLLARRSGLNLFSIGGLLFFIGEILTVIFVGGILLLAGFVVLIVAWFTVQEEAGQAETSPS
ncbi:MAG: DUF996 domain-containing protein [Aquificota bacterium]|nr:DUF996 domain-containing protein [Aquificota bacterium]